jgi:gliding motility-associated-like protein
VDTARHIALNITGGKPSFDVHWLIPQGGIAPSDTNGYIYTFLSADLPSSGTYTVTLNDQCNKKDTILVDIKIVDCRITVPNVVTANGDNINDVFRINGLENFPGSSLSVYNRWGNKVYTESNYQNNWKPNSSAGTYFYVLELTDGRKFNGFFELFTN